MRKLIMAGVAALLLGAASLSSTADAAVIGTDSLGTINVNDSANWGFTFPSSPAPGASDTLEITFTPGPNGVEGDSTSVSSRIGSTQEIESFKIELFDGATSIAGPTTLSNIGSPTYSFPSFTFSGLTPGNLLKLVISEITLSGAAAGTVSLSGTVSIVPLPGAVLLFGSALAGLGVMRRRKNETASATA